MRIDKQYPIRYRAFMNYQIEQTESFSTWRKSLRDPVARAAVRRRIEHMEFGNLGDVKPVGEGVSEARDVGAGYRLYFMMRGMTVIFLLRGGNKSTQEKDIAAAKKLAKEI